VMPVDPWTLLLVAFLAFLVAGALAPLETLGWWAGWYGDTADPDATDAPEAPASVADDAGSHTPEDERAAERYVVFLTGIHSVSDVTISRREALALEELRRRLRDTVVLEVFPYSVTNRALTGERVFAAFWRWALRNKLSRRRLRQLAGAIINLRNLWQVGVSADRRYGPYYNRGTAQLIVRSLLRHGYEPRRGWPVVLVGYSGGGQVAAGAAPFVKEATGGPVTVVSLGGVLAADPGLLDADEVLHVYGSNDRVHRLGEALFPGRWPLFPHSPWNVARERGTLTTVEISPANHTGDDGYLDQQARAPDGRSYFEVTVDVLAAIVRGETERLPVSTAPASTA
jgi:hypothetical protein